ncbi:HAD family phosphatase [Enterococcus faecium]|nr:HAD family phosphatase [Enterococcus faecium]
MKGIIFDFNGTMFLDSHLHEAAWLHMIHDHTKDGLSDEDILKNIHGRTNTEILKHFISEHLTASEIAVLSEEKESYYRMLCLQNENELQLTKGLEATLDQLTDQQIPLTIATATVKENVAFYFDIFDLARWFDWDKIVYDDGSFLGKPQPDIFLKAADKLSLAPADCLVIEDAYSGLLAAKRAGIGTIIAIDPFGKNKTVFEQAQLNKDGTIKDFTGFWTEHLSATSVNS